ncbi:MAG TPA: porin [Sphingomicrobium sp.]|nr:porin [Sphingomicrobium sp.]
MDLTALAIGATMLGSALTQGSGETPAPAEDEVQSAPVDAPAPKEKSPSRLEPLWSAMTLHKDSEADVLNEFRLVGRLHLDHYVLDSAIGDGSDLVARRARAGARARMFERLDAHLEADLDLEGGPLFSRLTDAYIAWRFSEAARLTAGKHSVKFTLDGATSSNELLTIDRSNVANNFWFTEEYAPGVSFSGRGGKWSYNSGIYSGGRRNRGLGEFDAGYFWLASVGHDLAQALGVKRATLRADYVYNKPDADSDFTRPFEHIGALVLLLDAGRWGFSGDFVGADGFLGQSDGVGATALPWLKLTDSLQLAGRYTFLKSEYRNGLRLARYENVTTRGRGDLYHELYGGLNYYIHGHRLKAQTGLTWANMRDRANDGGAYEGWTWTSALRVSW